MRRNGAVVVGRRERFERQAHLRAFEEELEAKATAHGMDLVREFLFHPGRRWRLDYALRWREGADRFAPLLGIEVQGLSPSGGHGKAWRGLENDCAKFCMAATEGWIMMPVTHAQIQSGKALRWIVEVMGRLRRERDGI